MRTMLLTMAILLATAGGAGAQKRPVTFDDVMQMKSVGSASVSPDGTQVLYTVRQWEPASEREKDKMESRTHVWKVAASGNVPGVQITFGERGESQPRWSPDGRFISFVSARGAGGGADDPPRPQIHVMPADGGEAWVLTTAKEGVTGYAWSPDSSRIAYVTQDPRSPADEAANKRRDDERVFERDFRFAHIKAAMVGAGPTNLWSMYGTNDIPNLLAAYFGGMPDAKTLSLYNARSAMSHVGKVTTPTLILHGSNDERVPIGQPMELFRALEDRGKTVELVLYPREGHGLTEYYHQRDRLERIHEWVTRYTLGGAGKKTTSP